MILKREAISTDAAPAAAGPYSQAIRAGGFVFTAGQIGTDPATGELAGNDVQDQAAQVLANLRAVLEAAGSGMDRIVKTTVYLADIADWPAVNEVYARFFKERPPARVTVQAAALPKGARVEIAAVALV